jgi:protein gp37
VKGTKIEWTDHTFNPWWGCTKVSEGCRNCYAETFSKRTGHDIWGPTALRRKFLLAHWQEPLKWEAQAAKEGRRHRVFCASMADVFERHELAGAGHDDLDQERAKLWGLIERTPHLDWQLLTKRPENVLEMVPASWAYYGFPENVWIGTSVEDQAAADARIPHLLRIPARVRFLSCEPLLGPVDIWSVVEAAEKTGRYEPPETAPYNYRHLHWVIVGGESGPGARLMDPEWAESIACHCHAAGVPVFVKQLGSVLARAGHLADAKGGDWNEWPDTLSLLQVREYPR